MIMKRLEKNEEKLSLFKSIIIFLAIILLCSSIIIYIISLESLTWSMLYLVQIALFALTFLFKIFIKKVDHIIYPLSYTIVFVIVSLYDGLKQTVSPTAHLFILILYIIACFVMFIPTIIASIIHWLMYYNSGRNKKTLS